MFILEKINLILAVLNERTVDCGHCIQFQHGHYRMLDGRGHQVHYRRGIKVMVLQAFDQSLYCCVNDKDIYALEISYITSYKLQEKEEYDSVREMKKKKSILVCWIKAIKR